MTLLHLTELNAHPDGVQVFKPYLQPANGLTMDSRDSDPNGTRPASLLDSPDCWLQRGGYMEARASLLWFDFCKWRVHLY